MSRILYTMVSLTNQGRYQTSYKLPSVIPKLIPDSKFIVVMREPVSMLYSTFWFSCTTWSIPLSQETKLAAPRIFHDRIMAKVDIFNHCMQDRSIPSISYVCELNSSYRSCILQRLHLTERCVIKASYTMITGCPAAARLIYQRVYTLSMSGNGSVCYQRIASSS